MADLTGLTVEQQLNKAQMCGANCGACQLAGEQGPVFMRPALLPAPNKPFDLLIVSERPENTDVRKGEPLAGRMGYILDKLLRQFGYTHAHLAMTNATLCTQQAYLKDGIWNDSIRKCSGRLKSDIQAAKRPDRRLLVLLLGKKALFAITGFTQIVGKYGRRGYPVAGSGKFAEFTPQGVLDGRGEEGDDGVIFFPTLHPTQVMREPALLSVWRTDVLRAFELAAGTRSLWKWPPIYTGFTHDVLVRLEQLAAGVYPRAGVDVETAPFDPLIAPLICTGIGVAEWAICFPHGKEPVFDALLKKVLQNKDFVAVTQNGNHDMTSFMTHGYEPHCLQWDILNVARNRYPQLDADLMSIASYHRFIEKWKIDFAEKDLNEWEDALVDETALDRMMLYCAKDAWATNDQVEPLNAMLEDEA